MIDDSGYSSFGIGVDRKHVAKWRFPQENGTFRCSQKVYVYSEIALALRPNAETHGPEIESVFAQLIQRIDSQQAVHIVAHSKA